MTDAPVILVLSALGMETALRIKADLPGATIHGLEGRVVGADVPFANFGETIRQHYQTGHPIIALCSAGITIRSLAPVLGEQGRRTAGTRCRRRRQCRRAVIGRHHGRQHSGQGNCANSRSISRNHDIRRTPVWHLPPEPALRGSNCRIPGTPRPSSPICLPARL